MEESFVVIETVGPKPAASAFEVVERKGIGHPDTICDALAESVSGALLKYYVEHFGRPLHHNGDKVLLVGGEARPKFGGGSLIKPMSIILAGRATASFHGEHIPIEDIAVASVNDWMARYFPGLRSGREFLVTPAIHTGSADLVELFARGEGTVPLANDSSIGVGFYPLTALESTVLDLDRLLVECHRQRPEIGLDTKIMATRFDAACELTVACAFVGAHLADLPAYEAAKSRLRNELTSAARETLKGAAVAVNTADSADGTSVFLTVTGSSAEGGDDGETGRGNRANGLITPCRPMSMEASAGKNCVTHTGKIYQILASRVARALVLEFPELVSCECFLVSRIGQPIDRPQRAFVRTGGSVRAGEELRHRVEEIIRTELKAAPALWREALSTGGFMVF